MKFKNKELGVEFELPEVITVRMQLQYMGHIRNALGDDHYLALWEGANLLLTEWKCKEIPNPLALDLDEANDFSVTKIIVWVGTIVSGHIAGLVAEKKTS